MGLSPSDYNSANRLMLGAMMTTMSLSMFMSNTSATAMMLPIIQAILRELQIVCIHI